MRQRIRFYSTADEYGFLSNFAATPIRLGGHTWPTVEHWFQAQKFVGTAHAKTIRRAATPSLAARLGRDRKRTLRRDWESVKVEIMRQGLRAKFTQHEELGARLRATGDARLVEHTDNDAYWGDGGDGRGRNMLGRLLMQVRDELG